MPQRPGKARNSAIVSIRFDRKQRFALDVLARKRRQTVTSVIEWALQQAIEKSPDLRSMLIDVWDPDEADRFVKIAQQQRELLSFDEERLWKAIQEDPNLCRRGSPNLPAIREAWEDLKTKFSVEAF
jgi:predicted transcriptional regulator